MNDDQIFETFTQIFAYTSNPQYDTIFITREGFAHGCHTFYMPDSARDWLKEYALKNHFLIITRLEDSKGFCVRGSIMNGAQACEAKHWVKVIQNNLRFYGAKIRVKEKVTVINEVDKQFSYPDLIDYLTEMEDTHDSE